MVIKRQEKAVGDHGFEGNFYGGRHRDRTGDLRVANAALSQLS